MKLQGLSNLSPLERSASDNKWIILSVFFTIVPKGQTE